MKKIFYQITFIFLFYIAQTPSSTAQEWSLGGELGATVFSFFQYTPPVYQEGGYFDRGYHIPHNEGWILSYYPKDKRSFFTASFTRFHPRLVNPVVRLDPRGGRSIASGTFNHITAFNMGYQFDIGRPLSLDAKRLYFEPIFGMGIEWLTRGRPNNKEGLINLESYVRKKGINPSLQAGFRLSYRYRHSKFSVKALGNMGLRYHAEAQYRILLPEEPILVTFRSKSDFLAAQVSYEYIFKSNQIESKKQKKARDLANPFSRQKKQELKIGIHPFHLKERISVNYELFPATSKRSLFLDATYFSRKTLSIFNVTQNQNDPMFGYAKTEAPHLDIRLGRNVYSEKETGKKWGVGYYVRAEFRLAENHEIDEGFEQIFKEQTISKPSYYAGFGATLQYKWLIKDRFVIGSTLFTDVGIGSLNMIRTKHEILSSQVFFDAQARIYAGYRF